MSKRYYLLATVWVLVIAGALITNSFLPAYAREELDLYESYEYSQMYLENEPYSKIIIEYDYIEGHEPESTAISELEKAIQTHTNKERIESIVDDQISPSESLPEYDSSDISRLKKKYQDHERQGNQITIHVLYLTGLWEDNINALGLSKRPEQIVIFSSVIDNIESQEGLDRGDIEAPVLVHEYGHLLSLVGLGYESDHEDDRYLNHCDESAGECVMAGSVEVKEDMTESPPIEFCELCREDMEHIKKIESTVGIEEYISYSIIASEYMIGIWASIVVVDSAGKKDFKRKEAEREYKYEEVTEEKYSSQDTYRDY
ncbi:MAG: hypothetical protein ACLFSM_07735 [Thermoplasmata archaeon]